MGRLEKAGIGLTVLLLLIALYILLPGFHAITVH